MKNKFKTYLLIISIISIINPLTTHSVSSQVKLSAITVPIYIDSNFTLFADNEMLPGEGTILKPFIIDGAIIDAGGTENAITIFNSSKYFVIMNSELYNGLNGIYLGNAANGLIVDNVIHDNIINGIKLEESTNLVIEENTIYNNGNGPNVCPHPLSLDQIRLAGHAGAGLHFDPSSDINVIGNNIHDNWVAGIIIEIATNITIQSNTIEDNGKCTLNFNMLGLSQTGINNGHGITVVTGSANITHNQIQLNDDYGVYLGENSFLTNVTFNNFVSNFQDPQANDNGTNNMFDCNYWDPSDGGPYELDGTANTTDSNPKVALQSITYTSPNFLPTNYESDSDDGFLSILPQFLVIAVLSLLSIHRRKLST